MKLQLATLLLGSLALSATASAASITQTFEAGEYTSNWGSSGWSNVNYAAGAGFLDSSIGGDFAGVGSSSVGQESSREFRNNTAGIDVILGNQPGATADTYYISFYIQITPGQQTPASGKFAVGDGAYGAHAAGIQVDYAGGTPKWQAAVNGNSWVDFTSVSFTAGESYRVLFEINPTANTSSVTLAHVTSFGGTLATETLSGLNIGANIMSNGQNGIFGVHLEGSAGETIAKIDNILISNSAIP